MAGDELSIGEIPLGPRGSDRKIPVKALDVNWDHATIGNFYKVLSSQGARFVTTWVPYEMEAMADFYGKQISQGNHLTPFDKEALGVILDRKITDDDYAKKIRSESGALVNGAASETSSFLTRSSPFGKT